MSLLEVRDLEVRYGGVVAVRSVSLRVDEGEVVSLLGSNGAGKTTTLRAISGLVRPSEGEIRFDGRDLRGRAPSDIVRMGLVQAPEGRRVFARMTVRENLELGAYTAPASSVAVRLTRALDVFPRLRERLNQTAGTLSGGEQQMLAVGRALMSAPKLLMLDEPSLGLSPLLVQTLFATIAKINAAGTTVLLVEQNARQALQLANRAYVLETGRVHVEGTGSDLLHDASVVEAYLSTG